jgi:hypothetical protein
VAYLPLKLRLCRREHDNGGRLRDMRWHCSVDFPKARSSPVTRRRSSVTPETELDGIFNGLGLQPQPNLVPNLRMLAGQAIHVLAFHEFKGFRLLRAQGLSEAY